ncbi:hypothetical protein NEDG_02000 [Nematocida displodere]|uniref:Uncharacterized protein n=1 Tax=Nematocida displodere TaxID=1805483 RepID=A0A177EF31_9MICR|nr:hypothetical protein NEDG_02000 [Nematocida displodere]
MARDKENRSTINSGTEKDRVRMVEENEYSTDEGEFEVSKRPVKMELQDDVYHIHEQIELEWPSQTVCISNKESNTIYIGSFPSSESKERGEILKLSVDLDEKTQKTTKTRTAKVSCPINRIRNTNNNVCSISDQTLSLFIPSSLKKIDELSIGGGYALSTWNDVIFYGNGGEVVKRDSSTKTASFSLSSPEVFSLAALSETVAVAATQTLTLTDFRANESRELFVSTCDINAVAYNGEHLLVCGDDVGLLTLVDLRGGGALEQITFHESPVSNAGFATRDIFATSSDCEVVIWDTTFTDEWEHHKYLSFVHQGQAFYKDFQFVHENTLITTSSDGLCVFSPKTELEE